MTKGQELTINLKGVERMFVVESFDGRKLKLKVKHGVGEYTAFVTGSMEFSMMTEFGKVTF